MPILYVAGVSLSENKADISPVTASCIREATFVIGEEKRDTIRQLVAVGAKDKEFKLLNEHSSDEDRYNLLLDVKKADTVVFFTDAGTPAISDPDYLFISMCRSDGIEIRSLAGASSITTAISVSGIDCSRFTFLGFPPKDNIKRREFFKRFDSNTFPEIFMERPYALNAVLNDLERCKKEIFIGISLSTPDEKTYFDTVKNLKSRISNVKKPFVIIIP